MNIYPIIIELSFPRCRARDVWLSEKLADLVDGDLPIPGSRVCFPKPHTVETVDVEMLDDKARIYYHSRCALRIPGDLDIGENQDANPPVVDSKGDAAQLAGRSGVSKKVAGK
jgi:hypothetical protein